jgi:uncharacterized protein (DUF433 family)
VAAMTEWDIYSGRDPRDFPAYTLKDVAKSLGLPASTLRAWLRGQANFERVFTPPTDATTSRELSFFNLIEAFVIAELRRKHEVPMSDVRASLAYLTRIYKTPHPLATVDLHIFNRELFAALDGRNINVTRGGQWPLEEVIKDLLRRVDKGEHGIQRFYPVLAPPPGVKRSLATDLAAYRPIVVDPEVAFGRPVINGTGIPTEVIADRRRGGDSIRAIAEDYDRPEKEIREALAFEGLLKRRRAA